MKKTLLFVVVLVNVCLISVAQDTTHTTSSVALARYDEKLVEGLVMLAMENPQIKSAENMSMNYKYSYARSKTAWLNQISVAGNLNELSIKQFHGSDPTRQNLLYPRYNVGVVLPIGTFVNQRKQSQADLHRYQAAANEVEVVKQNVRHDVMVAYDNYLMNQNLIALQYTVLKDAEVLFLRTEQKFSKGEITLEAYNQANKAFVDEKVRTITLERAFRVAEHDLEALIGMKLSTAIERINGRKSE
jgi:Outer membrane protein